MKNNEIKSYVLDLTESNICNEHLLKNALKERTNWEIIILNENAIKNVNVLSHQKNLCILYLTERSLMI